MSPKVRRFLKEADVVLSPLANSVVIATGVITVITFAGPFGQSFVHDFQRDVMAAMNQPRPPFVTASLVVAGASTTNSTPR